MNQVIPTVLKNFLLNERAKDLITHNKYEFLYVELWMDIPDNDYASCTSILSSILYEAGINPLHYMKTVPPYFLTTSSIDDINIPDNIESIGRSAFFGTHLRHITIPDRCTKIHKYAFAACEHLRDVVLPRTVEIIGEYAFEACSSLTHVTYGGTMREWKKLVDPSTFSSKNIANLVVSCSDGDLTVRDKGNSGEDLVWAKER